MSYTVYSDPDDDVGEFVNANDFYIRDGAVLFFTDNGVEVVYSLENIYMFEKQ